MSSEGGDQNKDTEGKFPEPPFSVRGWMRHCCGWVSPGSGTSHGKMGNDLPNVPIPCWLEEEPAQPELAVKPPSLSSQPHSGPLLTELWGHRTIIEFI